MNVVLGLFTYCLKSGMSNCLYVKVSLCQSVDMSKCLYVKVLSDLLSSDVVSNDAMT